MLKELLNKIKEYGFISKSLLAAELKVPEDLIEDGLNQLQRMGYLVKEETGEGCAVPCAFCPQAKGCAKEILTTYKVPERN